MSTEIQVPDYLKAMMDDGSVTDQTSQMMVATNSVPRLTTKGKTFRFKEGEDEQKAGQEVDLVIVGIHPVAGLSHTFYKDGYTPDASSPPDCSSMDGVTPDSWITNPINNKCATCPNQVWGSAIAMSGGKAKACRDSKQLYVAKAEDFSKDPKSATLYLLQVTVNSLKTFTSYGKELSNARIPGAQFVITRVSFDEEASVPKLEFKAVGALNEKLGMVSHQRSEEREWDNIPSQPALSAPSKQVLPDQSEPVKTADLDAVDTNSLIDNW